MNNRNKNKADRLAGNKSDRELNRKLRNLHQKYSKEIKDHQSNLPLIPVQEGDNLKKFLGDTLQVHFKDGEVATFKFEAYSEKEKILKGARVPEWISVEYDQASILRIKVLYR